jgi:hypothetical protein
MSTSVDSKCMDKQSGKKVSTKRMSMQKRNVKNLKSNSGEEYLDILNEDIKKVPCYIISNFSICLLSVICYI